MKTLSLILMSLCAIFITSCEVYSTDGGGYGQQGYMPPPGQVTGYAPPQYRQAPPPQYRLANPGQQAQGAQGHVREDVIERPEGHMTQTLAGYNKYHGSLNSATGVVTWTKNGTPVPASQVPQPAKDGFGDGLRSKGYKGAIIHNELSLGVNVDRPTSTVAAATATGSESFTVVPAGYVPPAAPRLTDSSSPPVVIRPSETVTPPPPSK